jgi:SAM-dependent methyltransferase
VKPPIFNPDWHDDIKALYYHDMQEIWDPNIARHIWNQYHNQLDTYFSVAKGRSGLDILDVGCAQGTLAILFAEQGHRVWAIDIRQRFIDYAASRYEKGNIQFICGNALEIDMPQSCDLIFANQILEHLVYPIEFTKRIAGWLKPGGCLVMTTPNVDYIKNSLPSFRDLGAPSEYEHLQFSADGDGHFFAYRGEDLVEICSRAGLVNVRLSYFETPWVSGHMKIRYIHRFMPARLLRFLDRLTLIIPWFRKRFSHQLMVEGFAEK